MGHYFLDTRYNQSHVRFCLAIRGVQGVGCVGAAIKVRFTKNIYFQSFFSCKNLIRVQLQSLKKKCEKVSGQGSYLFSLMRGAMPEKFAPPPTTTH